MLDPLQNLNMIKHCITNQAIPVILPLLNDNITLLSPHIYDCITYLEESQHTPALTLSLIHFTVKNYVSAIKHFLLHKNSKKEEPTKNAFYDFFERSIHIKMIELYPICHTVDLKCHPNNNMNDSANDNMNHNANDNLNESVKKYISDASFSDPLLLTFIIKQDISLLKSVISNFRVSIFEVQKLAMQENLLKEFYSVILDFELQKEEMIVKIDALMYFNRKEEVIKIVVSLKDDIITCYEICFYISECYNLTYTDTELQEYLTKYDKCNTADNSNDTATNNPLYVILSGDLKRNVNLNLMAKNNKTDFGYLQSMIKPLTRSQSAHTGIVFSNAMMNLSTTNDTFHRINIDLLCQTRHWNKCIGYSCLGMIHIGNENSLEILKNVLPNEKEINEGGSLISLGMIECNKKKKNELIFDYLLNFIESNESNSQTLLYGACLGLGLSNLGKYNKNVIKIFEKIVNESENVLAKEASIYGIGMNLINNTEQSIQEKAGDDYNAISNSTNIVNYLYELSLETQHEKIARACGISISLSLIQNRKVGTLVNEMLHSNNGIIRSNAAFCIGSSFAGTSDLNAISILLSLTNDVCEDVKRSCVIALGLVCCNNKETLFNVIEPLAVHHCQYVRSAVGITLGFFLSEEIACEEAGVSQSNSKTSQTFQCSGAPSIILATADLLEVLLYDSDALVRQSACLGVGFFLAQKNKRSLVNFKRIVERLNLLIVEKQENNCNSIGAIIGRSLMEGGGRNLVYTVNNLYGKLDKIKNLALTNDALSVFGVKENYNVNEIKVPELKSRRKRRLRRRYGKKEVDEVVADVKDETDDEAEEKEYTIKSGERMTYEEMKKCGLTNLAFKFVKEQ